MFPLIPSSFGDIIAAANTVFFIYTALSSSSGSSYDYQCLVQELRSFERILRIVERVLSGAEVDEEMKRDVDAEVSMCLVLLRRFEDSIKGYQDKLGRGQRGGFKASWTRKIGWGLFKAEEIANYRQRISQHKQNITIALSAYGIFKIEHMTLAIGKEISAAMRAIPPRVGYGIENAVILTTALGTDLTVPMQHCSTKEDMHQFLLFHFSGKAGQHYVEAHKYTISATSAMSMTDAEWTAKVRIGAQLFMAIEVPVLDVSKEQRQCLHCGKTSSGMIEGMWYICRRCDKKFYNSDTQIATTDVSRENTEQDDISLFKHICVSLQVAVPPANKRGPDLYDFYQYDSIYNNRGMKWRGVSDGPTIMRYYAAIVQLRPPDCR